MVPLEDLSFSSLPAAAVISGNFLRSLQQDDLDGMLQYFEEIVFARTSPQQKLQIVESYQRLGEIGKNHKLPKLISIYRNRKLLQLVMVLMMLQLLESQTLELRWA